MHPLLADKTTEQAQLIAVVLEGRQKLNPPNYSLSVEASDGRSLWPNFDYVQRTLHQRFNLSAREIVSTCPALRTGGGPYGWLWFDYPLRDESHIGVTIAGMWDRDTSQTNELVGLFLVMLGLMVVAESAAEPSPAEVVSATLSRNTAGRLLKAVDERWDLGPRAFDDLQEVLKHEPATWHSQGAEVGWTLSPFLRSYGDVRAGDQYVERVLGLNEPPLPTPEPLHPSSLALPEAIDYLNLVWRTHAGEPLVRIGRAQTAVKLILECATADEFESRISALCTVLDTVHVPGRDGKQLLDLREYLIEKMGKDEAARAVDAVEDLRAMFDLRVWRQHEGTDERGTRGMARLGISLPVMDWGAAWEHVQVRAVAALSALREEVELLP
jgi:hypothetical protein